MPDWLKKIWTALSGASSAYGFFTSEFFRILVAPILSSAVYAMLAWASHWDWATIYLGSALVFAVTAHGLFYVDERRARHSPANKLHFMAPKIFRGRTRQQNNSFILDDIQFGIDVRNSSTAPLSVIAEDVSCEIVRRAQNRVERITPAEQFTATPPVIVGPNNVINARSKRIAIGSAEAMPIQGRFSYRIKYGRSGREKHVLQGTIGMQGMFDPASSNIVNVIWDLDQTAPGGGTIT